MLKTVSVLMLRHIYCLVLSHCFQQAADLCEQVLIKHLYAQDEKVKQPKKDRNRREYETSINQVDRNTNPNRG